MNSAQEKLSKTRKPRVHITYDVETEGSTVKKELPCVVGVMGDFSGNGNAEKKAIKDRNFVQIDPDNFNEVMDKIAPAVELKVSNVLKNDGTELPVNLRFKNIDDFSPVNIVNQVEPLKQLLETRIRLTELLSKADRSAELEELLEKVLQSNEDLKKLSSELGVNNEPKGE
jgi:type VI secretion system protein ImpB